MTVASIEVIEDVIVGHFGTNVEDAEGVLVQYDNQGDFTPPDTGTWIRLKIDYSPGVRVETGGAGSNRHRVPGNMSAQCYLPLNVGSQESTRLIDVIATAFRGQSVSGVTFREVTPTKVGQVKTQVGDRFQVDVDVPFYGDIIA